MSTKIKTTTAKPRAKSTRVSKKQVETMLDKKYASGKLEANYELSYDYDIKPQYLDQLKATGYTLANSIKKPNLNLISKLPSHKIKTIALDAAIDEEEDDVLENQGLAEDQALAEDIDRENLEIETIGDKKYYLDHDKGIIYDMAYNNVGYIDEIGELILNE